MNPTRALLALASAFLLFCAGCGTSAPTNMGTAPVGPNASNVYLLQFSVNGTSVPSQILVFPTGSTGIPAPANTITLPANISAGPIAFDSAGNIYVATSTDIREYAASASGTATPIRTIPANTTSTLGTVSGLAVDSSGNIYALNLGVGIDVFSSTANGVVPPTRVLPIGGLTTLSNPLFIAVDAPGNLYVSNYVTSGQSTVLVFGPTANGNVAPDHVLNQWAYTLGTDASNNLYLFKLNAGSEIDVFAPGASGNANPVRTVSLGQDAVTSFAVGPVGDLYVGVNGTLLNNTRTAIPTIFEYSASASGAATPTGSFTPAASVTSSISTIAAH